MSIDTFILKLDGLITSIQEGMPAISDEIALSALALIKNRIVDKNEGINGAQYSTKPMLATEEQFIVKSAFKPTQLKGKNGKKHPMYLHFKGNSKATGPLMELPGGYKEFRELQGRDGSVVNLSYSGKMWQGVTIVGRVQHANTWGTIIGGRDIETQNKLGWMTTKYGAFLGVIPEEKDLLAKVYNNRLQTLVNNAFSE